MHMRTTLDIDDRLLADAQRPTGITEKTALIHAGLTELIQRAVAKRLAALAGTGPHLKAPPRRRFSIQKKKKRAA